MKAISAIATCGIALFLTMHLPAQANPAACAAIEDDASRLSCYDAHFAEENSGWKTTSKTDPLTDDIVLHASTNSEEPLTCNNGKYATLNLVCEASDLSFYVAHGCYAPGRQSSLAGFPNVVDIEYRLDDQKMKTRGPAPDYTDKAFGYWDTDTSNVWLNQIGDAEKMVIRFTPYRATPETLAFNLSGLQQLRTEFAKSCLDLSN